MLLATGDRRMDASATAVRVLCSGLSLNRRGDHHTRHRVCRPACHQVFLRACHPVCLRRHRPGVARRIRRGRCDCGRARP